MKLISRVILPLALAHCASASSANWFLGVQAGGQQLTSPSQTTVHNGSGYASPNDQDIYTVNHHADTQPLLGLQAGRRWELSHQWLSAFALGLQYQYFFNANVNGQVIEYSLPEFRNYNYSWKTDSNLILAIAKLNAINFKGFSPYLNVGVGAVFNSGSYSESALSGVTPRISPNYRSNSSARAAYSVGAGLDYHFRPELIMSLGYQYSDLDSLKSGPGASTWSTQHLNFGTYHSNAFLFGLTYIFDKKVSTSYQK